MSEEKLTITFVSHRVDRRGGQERSSHEVLSRLLQKGHTIQIVSFCLEDWPLLENTSWHKVPGEQIPIQIIKNLWFSLYTLVYLSCKKPTLIVTIGVSSWVADLRIIQFVHQAYYQVVSDRQAPLPNTKTPLHFIYQHIFARWTVLLEKMFFPQSKKIIAISNRVHDEVVKVLGDKSIDISVLHHCLDEVNIKQYPKEEAIDKILFVGALERKGVEKALEVLSLCQNEKWICDFVGAGNIKRWEEKAKELGIDNRVKFWGPRSAISFFEKADIFLFPSTYEPFGLVVSEAISYGVFPLASLECGAMELWSNRPDWLQISASSSPENWAKSLTRLIQNKNERINLLLDAESSMKKRDWSRNANEYERVLYTMKQSELR